MKKIVCITLATIALILVNCLAIFANPAGHGGYGGHGGYAGHGGYGRYGGHGGYGRYGGYGGYGGYGRYGWHFRGGVWIGPGWWGPYYPYYPYYQYYPYYPYYPYYSAPPVLVPQQPEEYVEPVPPPPPPAAQEELCMTLNIEFDTNKAGIKPKYFKEVEKVAIFMEKYPQTRGIIEGYTDNVGSAKYNLRLSQRRAESVVNMLVEKYGINESRLAAKGYGMTRPIADNNTREGRQMNRRTVANFGCVTIEK